MEQRREGGFSCGPCRQLVIVFRAEKNQYLQTQPDQTRETETA
jgi:hypothetical protein